MVVLQGEQILAPDADDQVIVNRPDVTLKLRPSGPPLDSLRDLTIQLNEQPADKRDGRQESAWTVPLTLTGRRSQARVEVHTFEEQPQVVSRSVTLRYVPPAPEIANFKIAQRSQEDSTCVVSAIVKSRFAGRASDGIKFNLFHDGRSIADLSPTKTPQGWQIAKKIELTEGVNWITLESINGVH
jgi:hypothetical protein